MARYIHNLLNYNCNTSQKILIQKNILYIKYILILMKVAVRQPKRLVLKNVLASATVVIK